VIDYDTVLGYSINFEQPLVSAERQNKSDAGFSIGLRKAGAKLQLQSFFQDL
jgi:hypothetical protein